MSSTRIWIGFFAMCVGMFMAILDIQVVASSLTNIQSALDIPADKLSWIQTGYLMAEVIAIPLTGWLTRAMSLRWMFVMATLGFTLASAACAACTNADALIAMRVIQGFFGGMLIPAVFTSVFTILPEKHRVIATMFAGVFAMVAPTLGPWVGGYLTETYSWHWIFLINVVPGLLVALLVGGFIRVGTADWSLLRKIDYGTIALAAIFLGSLELLLKDAPANHWGGAYVDTLYVICGLSFLATLNLCLNRANPFINLRRFSDLSFSLGCTLSFIMGFGLYGSTYLLAVFLGVVRGHTPIEIGTIIMVTGAVQLVAAPIAALLETRVDARLLVAVGFGLFGIGMIANGFQTYATDFDGLFWPQVLRGAAVMLCVLPATRLALDAWNAQDLPDASGLFNLLRNLGGAIGIALIDTILQQRTAAHGEDIGKALQAGSHAVAEEVGLTQMLHLFTGKAMPAMDEFTRLSMEPLITRAALVRSFNEAWIIIGVLFILALLVVPFMRKVKPGMGLPGGH